MRTIALLSIFAAALAAPSCGQRQSLPPPAPPPAPPPEERPVAPEQRIWRPSPSRVQVPDPTFAVAMVKAEDSKGEPAAEAAARTVTLLRQNGLNAQVVQPPADLPAGVGEAALKAADAYKGGGAADVYLLGEIRTGGNTQVRVGAVDVRRAKLIHDLGFQSPNDPLDAVIHKAMEEILTRVEAYWHNPERLAPRPQR